MSAQDTLFFLHHINLLSCCKKLGVEYHHDGRLFIFRGPNNIEYRIDTHDCPNPTGIIVQSAEHFNQQNFVNDCKSMRLPLPDEIIQEDAAYIAQQLSQLKDEILKILN